MKQTLRFALVAVFLAALTTACEKGPAEKVGEKVDNAVQDTKDAVNDIEEDLTKKK